MTKKPPAATGGSSRTGDRLANRIGPEDNPAAHTVQVLVALDATDRSIVGLIVDEGDAYQAASYPYVQKLGAFDTIAECVAAITAARDVGRLQ